jgi:hypothetical protein
MHLTATAIVALHSLLLIPSATADRSCYGCTGWCTYGDNSCFANKTYGQPPAGIVWHDVDSELGTQGRGWPSSVMGPSKYTRLPAKAEKIVDSTVWGLAQMSAGLKTRFSTAAKDVWARLRVHVRPRPPSRPPTSRSMCPPQPDFTSLQVAQ